MIANHPSSKGRRSVRLRLMAIAILALAKRGLQTSANPLPMTKFADGVMAAVETERIKRCVELDESIRNGPAMENRPELDDWCKTYLASGKTIDPLVKATATVKTQDDVIDHAARVLKRGVQGKPAPDEDSQGEALPGMGLLASAITTYNCTHPSCSHTALDLHTSGLCQVQETQFEEPRTIQIQALQAGGKIEVDAYSCSFSVSTSHQRCGLDSISYGQRVGALNIAVPLTPDQCRLAFEEKKFTYAGHEFKVHLFSTTYVSWYSEGTIDEDNRCFPNNYQRNGVEYVSSVEISIGKLVVTPHKGTFNPHTGRVVFKNGLVTNYKDSVVRDNRYGMLVWEAKEVDCRAKLSNVYSGPAKLYKRKVNRLHDPQANDLILIENEEDQRFAGFLIKNMGKACDVPVLTTQLPDIQLLVIRPGERELDIPFRPELDISANQVASNNAFLHLKSSMFIEGRFSALTSLICENERSMLQTTLALLSDHNHYALLNKYGPGHMITRMGSTAYVSRCIPQPAVLREFANCSQEVPVVTNGQLAFADPLTRVLQPYPTIVPCDGITPVRWRMRDGTDGHDEVWVCANPKLTPCLPPGQLEPISDDQLDANLDFTQGLQKGMFTAEQERQHLHHILAIQTRNPLATMFSGKLYKQLLPGGQHEIGELTLYGTKEVRQLTDLVGSHLIPFYGTIGDYWSTIVGVCLVLTGIKVLFGTVVRSYVSYLSRGCGCWVLLSALDLAFMVISIPFSMIMAAARQVTAPLAEHRDRAETPPPPPPPATEGGPGGNDPEFKQPLLTSSVADDYTQQGTLKAGQFQPSTYMKNNLNLHLGKDSPYKPPIEQLSAVADKSLSSAQTKMSGDQRYQALAAKLQEVTDATEQMNEHLISLGLSPVDADPEAAKLKASAPKEDFC